MSCPASAHLFASKGANPLAPLFFRTGPTELLAKRAEFDEGKCTREELRKVEDEAIRKEVERQQQVGIKSITDGEFRRHMYVRARVYVWCCVPRDADGRDDLRRFWGSLQLFRIWTRESCFDQP